MSDINLNFIRCFEVLSETLNFSDASEKLRLAQSNVSRQIKILEESLGVRLFNRTRQGVTLTAEGLRFKNEILPLTRELDVKLGGFRNAATEEAGEIRLGCFSEVGRNFFMPLCLEFRKAHPRITLEMKYETEAEILEGVQRSRIEFGIVSHPPIIEGLAAYPVMKQKIAMLAPAGTQSLSKSDIEAAEFAVFEKSDALLSEMWSKHVSKRNKPRISVIVNSHRSMLDAVARNGCWTVLPILSAREFLDEKSVRVVPGYEFEIPLYFIHSQGDWMPRKNLLFKQFILKKCKSAGAGGG